MGETLATHTLAWESQDCGISQAAPLRVASSDPVLLFISVHLLLKRWHQICHFFNLGELLKLEKLNMKKDQMHHSWSLLLLVIKGNPGGRGHSFGRETEVIFSFTAQHSSSGEGRYMVWPAGVTYSSLKNGQFSLSDAFQINVCLMSPLPLK